jgi:hypothetical protein
MYWKLYFLMLGLLPVSRGILWFNSLPFSALALLPIMAVTVLSRLVIIRSRSTFPEEGSGFLSQS